MFDDIDNLPQVSEEIETQETEQVEAAPIEQKVAPQESFRQLRELKEKAQRERDEAYRLLKQYEDQQNNKQQAQESNDDDLGLDADQYAEGKHLSKVDKKVRKLEEQLKQYQQQS